MAFQNLGVPDFATSFSPQLKPDWKQVSVNGEEAWEFIPYSSYLGKPLYSIEEAAERPATRLPDHNAAQYMNEGFDELQVYFAINQMMETLTKFGFTDHQLSTNPFHAFLYDPDIAMRDNAYYTDDTINFTTYSSGGQNAARDNSTIWHEIGHGIMDRVMGPRLTLADTGGLSEGMADFLAALVVQDVSEGKPFPGSDEFRINNSTGFALTNEVHDDGESYGGVMKDMLDAANQTFGSQQGLAKMTDLTLTTMRFTRNHPALTANDWFEHMLYVDELGKEGLRKPGEMKAIIETALAGRNFSLAGNKAAGFHVAFQGAEAGTVKALKSTGSGSRNSPILVTLNKGDQDIFMLNAKLESSSVYSFHYPVEVVAQYNGGPLQGAIHWVGEEKGSTRVVLNSESDIAGIPLEVTAECDSINREDGTCVDYVYVQVFENGKTRPTAKKRFYLKVKKAS